MIISNYKKKGVDVMTKKTCIKRLFSVLLMGTIGLMSINGVVEAKTKRIESMEMPKDATYTQYSIDEFLKVDAKLMKYDSKTNQTTEVNKEALLKQLNLNSEIEKNCYYNTLPAYFPDVQENHFLTLDSRKVLLNPASSAEKITDTSIPRYRGTCRIDSGDVENPNILRTGSAFLVGPNLAITSAHCVFDGDHNNEKYPNWTIYAAYNNHIYDDADVCGWKEVYYYNNWMDTHDTNYDIALCVLEADVGEQVGYYGLRVYTSDSALQGTNVDLQGYPANKDEGFTAGGYYQYKTSGTVTAVSPRTFESNFYTTNGFSGGPVLPSDNPYVGLGVLAGTTGIFNKKAVSVRISQDFSDLVVNLRQNKP